MHYNMNNDHINYYLFNVHIVVYYKLYYNLYYVKPYKLILNIQKVYN